MATAAQGHSVVTVVFQDGTFLRWAADLPTSTQREAAGGVEVSLRFVTKGYQVGDRTGPAEALAAAVLAGDADAALMLADLVQEQHLAATSRRWPPPAP